MKVVRRSGRLAYPQGSSQSNHVAGLHLLLALQSEVHISLVTFKLCSGGISDWSTTTRPAPVASLPRCKLRPVKEAVIGTLY